MSTVDGPIYQMLWDCKFCGKGKLLGQTHRHCPNCGAPQNAGERYFPSDADKVRAEDHEYAGADLVCVSCGEANGRAAKHCGNCGAPIEGGRDVQKRPDRIVATDGEFQGETASDVRRGLVDAAAPPKPPAKSGIRTAVRLGCLGVLVVGIAVAVLVGWKREGSLRVTGHSWTREITIETFEPTSDSTWCDALPADATSVRRTREVRSHDRVEDGRECQTRKVDRGNGTFVEKEECHPKYRDEPVYADKCTFTVNRFHPSRKVAASGASASEVPAWPTVPSLRTGTCVGCEREGPRRETYVVELTDSDGKKQSCDVPEPRWTELVDGTEWKGKFRVVGGGLDCSTLVPR